MMIRRVCCVRRVFFFRRFFCAALLFLLCLNAGAQNRAARNGTARNGRTSRAETAVFREEAARISRGMTREKLAAQVFLSAVEGRSFTENTRRLLTEIPAGGIMLFAYNVSADTEKSRLFIDELSRFVAALSVVPFIASDQEGGAVQRFRGKAALPAPLSYWERREMTASGAGGGDILAVLEQDAMAAGKELRRIGITLNLAPVAEPLADINRSFLKDRSYGPDAAFTASAAAAFVRGMKSAGIASVLKHYPGNSGADPHRSRAKLDISAAELERLTGPFRFVIDREEPAAVMVSHVIVPAWDDRPLSLSPQAVKRLRDFGFEGIILADDFTMAAAGAAPEVSTVEALKAGVDMIMAWPGDLRKQHRAVLDALERGELSEARLREAAERIIFQKLRYGLIRSF